MSRAIAGLVLLLVLGAGAPGQAKRRPAPQRVGVIPLSSSGASAAPVAAGVVRAIVKGLRSSRREVKVLDEGRAERLRACMQQTSCVRTLGAKYGLSVFITGHLEQQGKTFQLDLRAISVKSGEVAASEAYTLGSAREERLGLRVAQRLLAQARQRAGDGKPADGKPADGKPTDEDPIKPGDAEAAAALDKGDVEDPLTPKRPEKKATAPGERSGLPGDGGRPLPPRPPLSFGQRYWPGLTTGAVGLAAIGVGVGFGVMCKLSVDQGRETTSQVEAASLLDKARQNALVANILFGAGAAVLVASAVLFFFEIRGARAEQRSARAFPLELGVAASGTGIFVRGAF